MKNKYLLTFINGEKLTTRVSMFYKWNQRWTMFQSQQRKGKIIGEMIDLLILKYWVTQSCKKHLTDILNKSLGESWTDRTNVLHWQAHLSHVSK